MRLDGVWIGDMDRKITIEQSTETRNDTTSEVVKTWSTFVTAYAGRLQDSAENFEVQKQVSNNIAKWAIRYMTGITEQMRVNDHGEIHYIKGIVRKDRDCMLVLTTERRDG